MNYCSRENKESNLQQSAPLVITSPDQSQTSFCLRKVSSSDQTLQQLAHKNSSLHDILSLDAVRNSLSHQTDTATVLQVPAVCHPGLWPSPDLAPTAGTLHSPAFEILHSTWS